MPNRSLGGDLEYTAVSIVTGAASITAKITSGPARVSTAVIPKVVSPVQVVKDENDAGDEF